MFPPYAVAMVWMMACAWFNDKFQTRGPVMMFNCFLFVIGIAIMGWTKNPNTRYGGVFLGVMGICSNVPNQFGYQHANMVGQAKRALTLGMMVVGGAFGGIISGNIFQQKDAPNYYPALSICMAFQCITICLIAKNFWYFTKCNRKADRGELVIQGQPGFRYTL
jgi:MFS family permease